jgi:type I restriction enzyme R subunit
MVVDGLRTAFKKKYPQLEHDAIIKITGDADKDAKKVQSLIVRFNKERLPNIVVGRSADHRRGYPIYL